MNKTVLLSIGRKYVGLLLLTASLLLIASSNTNYVVSPSSKSGSVITFLTPKRPAENSVGTAVTSSGAVSVTSDTTGVESSSNDTFPEPSPPSSASTSVTVNLSQTTSPNTAPAPAASSVPPASGEPISDTPNSIACGSCRPIYNRSTQIMCPQYMACMY